MRLQRLGNRLNDGSNHTVADVPISLCVGDWDSPPMGEPHQPTALARGQPPWIAARTALNQNLNAGFLVLCKQSAQTVDQSETTIGIKIFESLMNKKLKNRVTKFR